MRSSIICWLQVNLKIFWKTSVNQPVCLYMFIYIIHVLFLRCKERAMHGPARNYRRYTGLNLNSTLSPSHIAREETRIFICKPHTGSVGFEPGMHEWLARQSGALSIVPRPLLVVAISRHRPAHDDSPVDYGINPLTAKLFNWNFHPLEVGSRWRDPQLQVSENYSDLTNPQLQVSENYSDLTKWRSTNFKICWLMSLFIFNRFKNWYVMCYKSVKKTNMDGTGG